MEPLVSVKIGKNQFVKMRRADAIRAGYVKPDVGQKRRQAATENKLALPEEDKDAEDCDAEDCDAEDCDAEDCVDDFTVIPGIGAATAAGLHELGFRTLDELRRADLGGLRANVRRAIEEWRNG